MPHGDDDVAVRLHTLVSTISAGIFETDNEGRVVYANPATLRVIGFTEEQFLGHRPHELGIVRYDVNGQVIEPHNAPLARAGRDCIQTVNATIRYSGLPVPDVWLESQTTPLYDANGQQKGVVVSFVDVTDRFRLEAERRAGQELVQDVLQLMRVGVMLVDIEGRIEYANPAALAGRSPADVIGQLAADPAWQLTDENGKTLPYEALPVPTVLREHRPVHDVQLGVPNSDNSREGAMRWLNVNATPRFGSQGQLRGAVLTVEDVTERRAMAEQLSQSQKIEGIGLLAGGVAHDFNNLLTAIIGNTDLALRDVQEQSELADIVREIRDAAIRGATLTRQLLTFARKQVVQPRAVQLDQLAIGIDRLLQRLLGEDIALRHAHDGQLWPVLIDPGQMEQVMMNMAINARDAMTHGGEFSITTRNVTLDASDVSTHAGVSPGDFVMLELRDTGVGMTEEVRAHLFQPFYTTKPVGSGSGLGLSICHGIVKQGRGFIVVDSAPGRGTAFRVFLPRSDTHVNDVRHANDALPATESSGVGTVMLVEDDDAVRRLATRMLRASGYIVHAVSGGEEAVVLSERLSPPPDVLVTDIVMPGMRGPDVARTMRLRYPDLPVLFITGYTDPSVVSDLSLDTTTGLLLKPFTGEQLRLRVHELVADRVRNER